jgi:hypothetical protein
MRQQFFKGSIMHKTKSLLLIDNLDQTISFDLTDICLHLGLNLDSSGSHVAEPAPT